MSNQELCPCGGELCSICGGCLKSRCYCKESGRDIKPVSPAQEIHALRAQLATANATVARLRAARTPAASLKIADRLMIWEEQCTCTCKACDGLREAITVYRADPDDDADRIATDAGAGGAG